MEALVCGVAKVWINAGMLRQRDMPKIANWFMAGKIQIDPMIAHVLKLEDINKGFELMRSGESIRAVVVY